MANLIRDDGQLPGGLESQGYSYGTISFASGNFQPTLFLDSSGELAIKSIGTEAGGTQRAIEIQLGLKGVNPVIDQFATLSCGNTHLSDVVKINGGDVYADGNLHIDGSAAIQGGDAYSSGNIQFSGLGSVTGAAITKSGNIQASGDPTIVRADSAANPAGKTILLSSQVAQGFSGISHDPNLWTIPDYCSGTYFTDHVEVSSADFLDYESKAKAGGSYLGNVTITSSGNGAYAGQGFIDGDLTIDASPSGSSFSGVYYVTGNITIRGDFAGSATFISEGNIHFDASSSVSAVGSVSHAFIADGNIHMTGDVVANGVMYANGNVHSKGNSIINGSIISAGGNFHADASLTVNYLPPDSTLDIPNVETSSFEIKRWRAVSP